MTNVPARCVDAREISADDMVAYIHGEAPPEIAGHLERCAACRDEAGRYARLNGVLQSALFRRACPETIVLGEYALDILSDADRQQVAAHLVECPHCLEESRGFTPFRAEVDTPSLPNPIGCLRRLLARALPAPAPEVVGLRGTSNDESTVYAAGDVRLTLSVQGTGPGGRGRVIAGMIEGFDEGSAADGGLRAELFAGGTVQHAEEIDDLGFFMLTNVPAGTYRIEVTLPDAVIVVDPFPVA